MAGSMILGTVYALDVRPDGDPFLEIVEESVGIASRLAEAGASVGKASRPINFLQLKNKYFLLS